MSPFSCRRKIEGSDQGHNLGADDGAIPLSAVDEDYITPDFHFDVATAICPTQASHVASSVPRPDAGEGRPRT